MIYYRITQPPAGRASSPCTSLGFLGLIYYRRRLVCDPGAGASKPGRDHPSKDHGCSQVSKAPGCLPEGPQGLQCDCGQCRTFPTAALSSFHPGHSLRFSIALNLSVGGPASLTGKVDTAWARSVQTHTGFKSKLGHQLGHLQPEVKIF